MTAPLQYLLASKFFCRLCIGRDRSYGGCAEVAVDRENVHRETESHLELVARGTTTVRELAWIRARTAVCEQQNVAYPLFDAIVTVYCDCGSVAQYKMVAAKSSWSTANCGLWAARN